MATRKKLPPSEPEPEPLALIPEPVQLPPPSFAETARLKRLLHELAQRQAEGLRLYEPLPIIQAFHKDPRDERLLRGSNRAGKTLGAAVELARAVTGQDPFGKYQKENGRAALVGLDGRHNGDVLYRKLFRAGAFKMVRDEDTGDWRAFRPATEWHRRHLAKPVPPLIPQRFVKEIAWEEKKRSIPSRIVLTTGWELTFYSSKGCPPNGIDIDILWIDEEIENEAWWPEMVARLLDRKGKAWWSATPQVASEHLYNLHVRAEEGDPGVGEHIALLEDNPHIDPEEKAKFCARLVTDDERRVRIKGEFALTGYKVYPEYAKSVHNMDWEGPIPLDWTRYLIVDPGRQVCAVLFGAVPPPELGEWACLYDELYLKNCDAETFGRAVGLKSVGISYHAMLIDSHAGRITEMGSGKTIESQYLEALKRHSVQVRGGSPYFLWGADDPKAGVLGVHDWLRIRPDGKPRLRVLRGRLENLEWEVERYHNKRIKKLVTDEPEKKNDHLMDCVRYFVMHGPVWVKPPRAKPLLSEAVRAMKAKKKKKANKGGPAFVRFG